MRKIVFVLFVFAAFVLCLGVLSPKNKQPPVTPPVLPQSTAKTVQMDHDIPGLLPVDVYLNMEKRGYKTKKDFGAESCLWICKKEIGMTRYLVEAYGNSANSVRRINASVATTVDKDVAAIALPEFSYLATLPYQGSDPSAAKQWVEDNIGQQSKTNIGGVVFELSAGNFSIYVE